MKVKGNIHSFESFGTQDGPGIRFVFFMQGCPLRCLYCHNPDTWDTKTIQQQLAAEEAFAEVRKVKGFIRNGGVTISGGEPLLQADFILELFKMCKAENIHTCIDTSGFILNNKVKEVLEYTDLVLLDIKHINAEKYKSLTSAALAPTLKFLDYLEEIKKPTWLRYVLTPDLTDDEKDLHTWAEHVAHYKIVERVDILPFHQMGRQKWEQIGKGYPLKDLRTPTPEEIKKATEIFSSYGLKLPY